MTPTDASRATLDPDALVDTSVAVPLEVADHEQHHAVVDAVGNRALGLAGYAAFETFSVLTRSSVQCERVSLGVSSRWP